MSLYTFQIRRKNGTIEVFQVVVSRSMQFNSLAWVRNIAKTYERYLQGILMPFDDDGKIFVRSDLGRMPDAIYLGTLEL